MKTIKTAVIGVGSMGRNHARVYTELAEAELLAVADASQEQADNIGEKYGVKAYNDYREMLEREQPEAVSIAVPTAMHEEVATVAMQAGAHILIEKPIASTVDEGERLIALARKLERKLMVGHIVRFNPAIQALKEKLMANELGRIFQILCRRVGPFPARIRDVGVIIDLAPHDIDIMRYLTGAEPTRVFAELEKRVHTEHEDLLLGLLRFENSITGSLEINWLTPTKVREIVVLGERGMFLVNDLTQDLYFYENAEVGGELWPVLGTIRGVSEGQMVRYQLDRYEPLKAELQTFVTAVANDSDVPVSGEDGLAALRLALALIESGQNNQVVEV